MNKKEIAQLAQEIISDIRVLLTRRLGLSSKEIDDLIVKSDIENRIKEVPDVFLHLSDEQLIDTVR